MQPKTIFGAACATCALAVPVPGAAAQAAPQAIDVLAGPRAADALLAAPLGDEVRVQGALRRAGHELEADRHLRLARTHARVRGQRLSRADRTVLRADLRALTAREVRRETRALRGDLRSLRTRLERAERRARTTGGAPDVPIPGALASIAACESGGDPGAIGGGGLYRGKYQFDRQTWSAVGGSGDPAAAPETEQDRRAAMLYARAGSSPWPVCGR